MTKTIFFAALATVATAPLVAFAQQFQPLTGLPVFENITAGGDLAGFFNQLYVLSVGAAAVIAVAQIMIAGFRWATSGGSHSAIEQSRDLIKNSIFGLLLVLSPTIVFGIINPDILSLNLDTSALKRQPVVATDTVIENPDGTTAGGVAISLKRNSKGAYDDVCNFNSSDFSVYPALGLKTLGKGSTGDGRQCCALSGGTVNETQLACNFEALILSGRWHAHLNVTGTIRVKGNDGIQQIVSEKFILFTPGTGYGSFFKDLDTLTIHGFKSESDCQAFLKKTPAQLFQAWKAKSFYQSPAVGLIEAAFPSGGDTSTDRKGIRLMEIGDVVSFEEVTKSFCEHRRYGKRNP